MTTQSYLINETTQYQGTTSQIVKDIFKVIKQNITEDELKKTQTDIQTITDDYNTKISHIFSDKF